MRIGIEKNYKSYMPDTIIKSDKKAETETNDHHAKKDTLEISNDARILQAKSASPKPKGIEVSAQDDGTYVVSFMNPAYIQRAVKNGYIDVGNKKIALTDEQKDELTATANEISERMTQDTLNALAEHNMKVLEQQSEALGQQSRKDMEMMDILRRIIRGEKVSPVEEKELSEYNPEMYTMAKQTSSLIQRDESVLINNSESKERIDKEGNSNFDSPLKHLHEYTTNMKAGAVDGAFSDIEISID